MELNTSAKVLAVLAGFLAYVICTNRYHSVREKLTLNDLPEEIQSWYRRGSFAEVNGNKMFYILQNCKNTELANAPTFALLHGFPSSSYEYHKVLDKLSEHGHVIVNDHIGFGFSDKPDDYTYSMGEAAENVLALWRKVGVREAHVISHDMGDTVLTEILARRHRDLLPDYFNGFFKSVTFTNGGMNFALINMRVGQKVLIYKKLGNALVAFGNMLGINDFIQKRQLSSIWSPTADPVQRDKDIDDLCIIGKVTGASDIIPSTIHYLWDRYYFEFRWYAALREIDVPTRFIWGDSDAVAPVTIPMVFQNIVPKFDLTLVPGAGHFWMLECPDVWLKEVVKIVDYNRH